MIARPYISIVIVSLVIVGVVVAVIAFGDVGQQSAPSAESSASATTTKTATSTHTARARVGTTTLALVVAESPRMRRRGLSGRTVLPRDGMLFVFDSMERHTFWMKDMLFPIDIIWLDTDGRVVDIKHRAQPDSYPEHFTPEAPAVYVIETRAGFADKHEIQRGDLIEITETD